ncbi:MAG TPA: hypothetical protein DE179_12380 [Oceanospirillaceae bacterium]|nr:hypothetical protein [Oceanospirillaceae bacterium]
MSMYYTLTLMALALALLLWSLKPAYTLCRRQSRWGWRVVLILIVLFIIGYGVATAYILLLSSSSSTDLVMAIIFFGGSLFVNLVLYLSLVTIDSLDEYIVVNEYNALYDSLTHLPNRKHLIDYLQKRVQANTQKATLAKPKGKAEADTFAVVLLDLDKFKSINDTLGHMSGDLLLKQLAQRLSAKLKSAEFIARMGGDEFICIVSTGKDSLDTVAELCQVLRRQLQQPFSLNGHRVGISASPSVALYPQHGEDVETLLKHADVAMYEAKRQQLLFSVFEPYMSKQSKRTLEIAARLPGAVSNQEFELQFQPIFNLAGHVFSTEALIRWPQADGTMIPPVEFIPLAEQSYLIREVTRWVVESGLERLKYWHSRGHKIKLQVNISPQDLVEFSFVEFIKGQLQEKAIEAAYLTLEITENAIIHNQVRSFNMLSELHQMGVNISLDDFGTGFSSLSLVNKLPLSQLKIDHSFVSDMDTQQRRLAIVQSTVDLGKNMSLEVIAEGVENSNQIEILDLLGCEYIQGNYLAKPMPIAEFECWLEDQPKVI